MKKLIAVFIIFSLLWGNVSATYANVPGKFLRGSAAVSKIPLKGLQYLPEAHRASSQSARLATQVQRAARRALLGATPKFNDLRLRALEGRTAFLPQAILEHPVAAERALLLRRHFAAAAHEATPQELSQALVFWRKDLQEHLPELTEETFYDALADAAALGIFGTPEDLPLLEHFYNTAKTQPAAEQAATAWTRALLVHQQYTQLADFFVQNNGVYPALQNSLAEYAQKQDLPFIIAQAPTPAPTEPLAEVQELGIPCRLTFDHSLNATELWVSLGKRSTPANIKPAPTEALTLPQNTLQASPDLTLGAPEIPSAVTTATPAEPAAAAPADKSTPAVKGTPKRLPFFTKKISKPNTRTEAAAPVTSPLAPLWKNAKNALAKIKNLFRRKNVTPAQPVQTGPGTAFQRAGIYMASYVMGLEVATPVIANFGSSFGLSLEENILVAVATYLPYSLGAFFSNWTKKVLGRKHSLNLGLGMMASGLLAGVTLCGLNGAFVPQADAMLHFYKVLGCITLASFGGVLVHNSVGPIMTELSKNASELVRQKRSAYTEFSRALGMASSFAFPFIATKLLGMDWSLAFALPLPLIGAAALGVNAAKIPNTKPLTALEPAKQNTAPKGFLNAIKNNEYIRLFKEEKGVGAFLSGLFIMNAVETAINSGFLFLLPSMTKDPSSQYLFGLAQFAAPFLLGRYLASKFLQWFPKHNMSLATLMAGGGALASLATLDNVYALTAALFLAETGISTAFTLGFARTAKNPQTQDRVTSLIVASALSAAFGPLWLTQLAQTMIDAGMLSTETATAIAMLGIPAGLAVISAMLFKRVENLALAASSAAKKLYAPFKKWFKRRANP